MQHKSFALDIIFLKDGVIKSIVEFAPPCNHFNQNNCPFYDSVYSVNQIIQLPAGSTKALNIKVGNKLNLNLIQS